MDILRWVVFGLVSVSVWSGVHWYLGRHFVGTLARSERSRRLLWALVIGHGTLAPLVMFLRSGLPQGTWYRILTLIAYVGMGFVSMLFVTLAVRDILAWASHRMVAKKVDPERRALLAGSFNLGAFAMTGVATGVGLQNAIKVPDVKRTEIRVEGLAEDLDGFTIVQLSDLHIGPTLRREWLQEVVNVANRLGADMIAITGDLVDGYVRDIGDEVLPIGGLTAKHGVFYVTGNHEYYWDGPAWSDFVESQNIRALNNAHHLVKVGAARLLVGGVTDYKAGQMAPGHATDSAKAMAGAPAHDFNVLLAHQPSSVYEAAQHGWKLQISGHTHGGQFFPWNLVVNMVHEFATGLDRFQDTLIYVSRGAGFWGPPTRLLAPSEITHLTLRRA